MKKFQKILKYVMLSALSVAAFVLMTHYYYVGGDNWFGRDLEKVCYGIWCFTFAVCFYDVVSRFRHLWTRIIAAITTSLLLTTIVFLANNFWRYLSINCEFNWEYPIPYGTLMKWDITYTHNYGEYRYPMVFAVIAVLCGLKIFLSHPKIKRIYQGWNDKFCNWLYIKELKKESLSDLYCEAIKGPDTSKLVDYVRNMPLNEDSKSELMNCVDEHQDCFLIYLLFMHYEELLSREEYIKYRMLYADITESCINSKREYYATAKVEFPEVFRRLNDKFDITDKE